ncbi:MAG: M23 family metallopeptidase [Candidatus Rokubacteria bacterium]|nr:M23 family metallopeptidase [Candidatus Rokubacteria bacterium]
MRRLAAIAALLVLAAPALAADESLRVSFHPVRLQVGQVGWLHVRGAPDRAGLEGLVAGQTLGFFPHAGGHVALVAIDIETPAGTHPWSVTFRADGAEPRILRGTVAVLGREFSVQRLTLPPAMVDLDPETERRAVDESGRLRTLYRTISSERLWRGRFQRPVAGTEPGTGFGSRRIINGQPRMPHSGIDYAAPRGTPVVAANAGRVALVADFFFPGRLVVIDHGLGLYTLYFHLDTTGVEEGALVERGQPIGTIGTTGRSTGPHLHFGAQVGSARIDPAALLALELE